jgi:hypothetical protein
MPHFIAKKFLECKLFILPQAMLIIKRVYNLEKGGCILKPWRR